MKAKQTKWHQKFQESFQESLEAWELEYRVFFDKKSKWVIKTSEQAVQVGSQEVLSRFGKSTRDAIAEASSFVMPPDIAPPGDIKNLIVHILRPNVISNLLRGASNLQEGIGAIEPVILTDLGRDPYMTGEILDKIRAFQTEENEELLARLALVQYDKMLDTLDEAVKGLKATVDDANAASAGNFMKMLTRDNFRRKGRNYVKDTLVAVTLIGGLKYETHTIEGYKDYRVSIRDVSADMAVPDDSMIGELGFAGLQGLLKRALEGLEEEQERIFGGESTYINQWNQSHSETTHIERIHYFDGRTTQSKEIERTRYWTTVEYDDSLSAKDYRSRLAAWEKLAASEKQQSRYVELRGGEFNRHSGYAPQFKSSPNSELSLGQWQENLQFEGLGEKGRIIGLYMQHQLIQAAGEGDFAKPFYARKIWDDRGDAFKSPTLRSVVDIVSVVAAAAVSAASLGAATPLAALAVTALVTTGVGIADDVLFTALDIGTGYKEADEALAALGKKTLTSFATNLIGLGIRGGGILKTGGNGVVESTKKAFEGLAGAMGEFGESAIGSTLLHGTQAISTNVVSSAINAIGSDNWGESFLEGAFGGNAMAGVVSGMVGSFVSGNLNHGFSQGDFGRAMGDWSSAHRGYLGALSSTFGGAFSATINYGLTGSANINLLNSSMFGLGNTGLLEMRFGRGGFSMQFGMGGTDLSVGRLVGAVRGINVIHQNQRSLAYELDNSYKLASVLRSSYSYGGRSSRSQFDRIIEGTDRLHEGFPTGPGGRGKTIADGEGGRDVYLEPFYNDKSSRMRAAVILSHESYRDGITTDEVTQRLETLRAVRGHTETAIRINQDYGGKLPFWDENIEMDMLMYSLGDKAAFEAYADANYDSSADNWRLMNDGSIEWDGKLDLYDEEGNLLLKYMGKAITSDPRVTLGWFLDYDDAATGGAAAEQIMIDAGWRYHEGTYKIEEGGRVGLDIGDSLSSRLFYAVHKEEVFNNINRLSRDGEDFARALSGLNAYEKVLRNTVKALSLRPVHNHLSAAQRKLAYQNLEDALRLVELTRKMVQFFGGDHSLFDPSFVAEISQGTKESGMSPGYPKLDGKSYHNAVDVAGEGENNPIKNQPLLSGWSGRVDMAWLSDFVTYETREAWEAAIKEAGSSIMFDAGTGEYRQYGRAYGNSVTVDYGFNFENTFIPSGAVGFYAHMYDITVKNNQMVTAQTPLGTVGSTGASTAAHLHRELYTQKHWGEKNIFSRFYGLKSIGDLTGNPYYLSKIFYDSEEIIWNNMYGVYDRP